MLKTLELDKTHLMTGGERFEALFSQIDGRLRWNFR
jgi:hypothetical protein